VAEGLPVESYLDTGDRANFAGADTIRLYPDFSAGLRPDAAMLWESKGAAPLVMAGQQLTDARRLTAGQMTRAGNAPTPMARAAG
jgi:hypothetical protein